MSAFNYVNNHYERYPVMKPWVGVNYSSRNHKRLLIVGESHYLPSGSTKAHDLEVWYSGCQDNLNSDEKGWIFTAGIIQDNLAKNFPNKAHGIFKNSAKAINSVGYGYDNPSEAMNDIAFMNFFQRPAESEGGSIHVKPRDIEISSSIFLDVLKTITPELVVFVSSKAGWYGKNIVESLNLPVAITPHPSSQWWNRQAKRYGGYGRDVIPAFLKLHQWYKA
jgi:hypothetical protein